jgi:uncharacterized protein YndB with AHSA1/START domain
MSANPKSVITVKTTVTTTVEKVWSLWTDTNHIIGWNNASEDWHTPKAENDLRPGGKFLYRMEAKDGSFGFDFSGLYSIVEPFKTIKYTLDDGRKVEISFSEIAGSTDIVESFEAEDMNSIELQRAGWQAILDNFKKYANK